MLFSDISFLYYFLPVVLLLYFMVPGKYKNSLLLLASLFFYAWGEPRYVVLIVLAIVCGYSFARLIDCYRGSWKSRLYLFFSCLISLGLLGYFKYATFFISNLNALTGWQLLVPKIVLPIGISFYTFQIISYTVDVYRGQVEAQRNLLDFATYVALFPQLIAGPIVRYADVDEQLKSRRITWEQAYSGVTRFIIGLAKKVLLSNVLAELCTAFRSTQDNSVLFCWLYALAFCLHIYFDFSGYSDMAIGLGKILGFSFPENFSYPYMSRSISEFWRRWHMTLGSWFRDYVYIPLGGNRVAPARWVAHILLVWLLTGLWHGAAWNFVLWGLFFALLLIVERIGQPLLVKLPAFLRHAVVLFCLLISFVLFNADSLSTAWSDIGGLFGAGGLPRATAEAWYYLRSYLIPLLLAILGCSPLPVRLYQRLHKRFATGSGFYLLQSILLLALLLLCTAYLVDGSFNPFLYFRF